MGNTDSIPVVSQVKSLVLVIGGQAEEAKEVQENFARTGIIASQINSLRYSIEGNNEEALKIQEEFSEDFLKFAETAPIIGHGFSAGYAIAGDTEKAEEVAIKATKSTVVAAAGIAGAVCGPGAPACGAALATSANAAWDGIESGIAGESRGMIKGFQDIHEGKASLSSGFDTVAEQGLIAAGGALGASGVKARLGPKKVGYRKLCKRSVTDQFDVFDYNLSDLPDFGKRSLPASFREMETVQWTHVDQGINAVFSTFLIIKMFLVGHPRSKIYFEEVCHQLMPTVALKECEMQLALSLNKYEWEDSVPERNDPFDDSLNALVFEMENMVTNTAVGQGLVKSICSSLPIITKGKDRMKVMFDECVNKIENMLVELRTTFSVWDSEVATSRVKREGCIPTRKVPNIKPPKTAPSMVTKLFTAFKAKHVPLDDVQFNSLISKSALDVSDGVFLKNIRPGRQNTIIKNIDANQLKEISSPDYSSGKPGAFITDHAIEIIQVDQPLQPGAIGIKRARAFVRFMENPETMEIFHMEPPQIISYN